MELAALKESLRKLAPSAMPAPAIAPDAGARPDAMATGFVALDAVLAWGGWPRGALSELAGARSSGKTALAFTAIAAHTRAGGLAAFVDGRGELYPPAAAALGIDLARLLVVTPAVRDPHELVLALARAVEIVARSRAFAIIALDLPDRVALGRAPAQRLKGAAHRSGAATLILCRERGSIEGAAARLGLSGRGDRITARIDKGSASGAPTRAELTLSRPRFDDAPAGPVAEPAVRVAPGHEPPTARSRGRRGGRR